MTHIVTLSSSPSAISRTDGMLSHVVRRIEARGHDVSPIYLRDLPAEPLLRADTGDPAVAAAVRLLESADAVVVTTPVYKAAYSGLLKVFLDLLPQFALRDKAVLPLVTGGSPAHVLAVDYALRPVLTSLGATHVAQGWFVLAQHVVFSETGAVRLDPAALVPLNEVTDGFLYSVEGRDVLAARPGPRAVAS